LDTPSRSKNGSLTGAIKENLHATHTPHAGRHSFCCSDTRRRTNLQQPSDAVHDRKGPKAIRANTANRADKTYYDANVIHLDINFTSYHDTNTRSDTCAHNWSYARSGTDTSTRPGARACSRSDTGADSNPYP